MITTIFVITEILFFCFVLFFYQRLTVEPKDLITLLNELQIVMFFCDGIVCFFPC